MRLLGTGTDEAIEVDADPTGSARFASVSVMDGMDVVTIRLDSNHLRALEIAIRAAHMELDARSIGP